MDYLPFQTISFDETQYKLFGMVTNMDREGGKLTDWHHERCWKPDHPSCGVLLAARQRITDLGHAP
jgi:hypothetical protein